MGLNLNPTNIITGAVGAFTGNPAMIAGAVGSALSGDPRDVANQQARGSLFAPVNINTNAGSTSFNSPQDIAAAQAELDPNNAAFLSPERRAELEAIIAGGEGFQSQLSPELQAIRDQLVQGGQDTLNQYQTFDPAAAGALFTQQLDDLAKPKEEKQRLALENRLFKQGLLSSSAGAEYTGDLATAQFNSQGARNITGMEHGQNQQAQLFNNAMAQLQASGAYDKDQLNMILQSANIGNSNTAANTTAASIRAGGQNAYNSSQDSFWNGLVSSMPTSFGPTQTTGNSSTGVFNTDLGLSGFDPQGIDWMNQ